MRENENGHGAGHTWGGGEHAACCPVDTNRVNDLALAVQVWPHHGVGALGGIDSQVECESAVLMGLLKTLSWQQVVQRPEHMRQRLGALGSALSGEQDAAAVPIF